MSLHKPYEYADYEIGCQQSLRALVSGLSEHRDDLLGIAKISTEEIRNDCQIGLDRDGRKGCRSFDPFVQYVLYPVIYDTSIPKELRKLYVMSLSGDTIGLFPSPSGASLRGRDFSEMYQFSRNWKTCIESGSLSQYSGETPEEIQEEIQGRVDRLIRKYESKNPELKNPESKELTQMVKAESLPNLSSSPDEDKGVVPRFLREHDISGDDGYGGSTQELAVLEAVAAQERAHSATDLESVRIGWCGQMQGSGRSSFPG